jgi:hypothetical protein
MLGLAVTRHFVETLFVQLLCVFDCLVQAAQQATIEANTIEFVLVGFALRQV